MKLIERCMPMERSRCRHCGRIFTVSPRVGERQKFCGRQECQRARKSQWTREKLRRDEAYRLNQVDAQRLWRQRNPGYWRQYRERSPAYTQRNREKQRERNRRLRSQRASLFRPIANMDEIKGQEQAISGIYSLIPVPGAGIAKMDAILVEIRSISVSCSQIGGDCKQMTR